MKTIWLFLITLLLGVGSAVSGTSVEEQSQVIPKDENSHDLFSFESTYALESDFQTAKLGNGGSLYNDLSYDHRFLIKGKWYFRTGIEYERLDFGGTNNGLPDHLQSLYGHLAVEYVVKDHAGAGIELDPGVYFQDNITANAFDVPWKLFVSFLLKKDKIFGVIGVGGALYQDPIVAPGGGIIWLFNDKLRLEGVFPKPALVYSPTDNLQFRLRGEILVESFRTDDVLTTQGRLQLHNAIVRSSEVRAGLEARYDGFKPVRIIAGAGWTIDRDFDFFRADQRARVKGAPYVRLGIEARF